MIRQIIYNNKIMLTILVIMLLSVLLIGGMKNVKAKESVSYEKSFMSIEIEEGDTLYSIANEYAKSSSDCRDYIKEVKSINNLKGDTIHAGCYLMIPVYTPVQN